MKPFSIAACFCFVLLFYTASLQAQKKAKHPMLDNFCRWFAGDFKNIASTGQIDSSSHAYNLHHVILTTWNTDDSTRWVYEEINYAGRKDSVFRQVIWLLREVPDGSIIANQFFLKKAWLFTGAWDLPDLLRQLNSDYLGAASFCEISFDLTTQRYFKGINFKKICPVNHKNVVRYSSESSLTQTQFDFWERGWDSHGNSVWGNQKEGYQFVRILTEDQKKHKEAILIVPVPKEKDAG